MSTGGGVGGVGGLANAMTALVPGQQPTAVDNSFNVSIGDTKADTDGVMSALDDYYLRSARPGLRNTPS